MAVAATVMGIVRTTDQGVVVAAGTTGCGNPNQGAVIRSTGGVGRLPAI